ncbi:MAG: winged helix-turn-helix transcriptional regulator [Lachnospiraceae bacterium]|nr:winged helix-turn-helix transcriptional regulator [Lachnospiraceae bacterium]
MYPHSSKEIKRFNHLISETDAAYHEMSLKFGLSDSAMQILYTLCGSEDDGCLLRDICRLTGLSKQTVHSAIRNLERDGILRLEMVGAKNKNVLLTEKGRRLAERTAMKIIEAENRIFASWPEKDVEIYLGLIRRYLEDFRKEIRNLGPEQAEPSDV